MAFLFRSFKVIDKKAFPFFFLLCRTWPSHTRVLGRGDLEASDTSDVYPLTLDQASQGYKDFDRGAAKKFVIDPHGLLEKAA